MNKLHSLLVAVVLAAVTGVAVAESKIGFVNAGRVTSEAPQADAARANLEEEFGPRDRAISEERDALRELETQLNRDGAVMSEDEQQRLQRDLVARQRELRRAEEEFREDFNMRRNEELGRLQRRIVDTINDLAEAEGFDLIVSEGVIFASDRVDVTDRVLERLQQDFEGN
ncbi:OmpH family outer membrane protein [Aquisalimonas sp. 2447]|uniref:OmpH family outer membrane protein n=1 Tax=Aquisalimonas sp. 2447 TaxID=2740807 RepID=UPI0014327DCB|nr:OmpH family outer membrane protein [Aquisalimonas sp. 2447]QIT55590.1 OmpH family outer membrane protein [Aquisalimonas sp. 2447]